MMQSMRPELVLILAMAILAVLLASTLILLGHWFGYPQVLGRLALILTLSLALILAFKYRVTLLRALSELWRVGALLLEAKRRAREVLQARKAREVLPAKRNRYIKSSVKREVWRRDRGRCVECRSRKNIEYDHIIPHSKGGSNTARNIQLLCEKCNRKKSANIE